MNEPVMKIVRYYCPSCRKTVFREVTRARALYRSYCVPKGKEVVMRKLKHQ